MPKKQYLWLAFVTSSLVSAIFFFFPISSDAIAYLDLYSNLSFTSRSPFFAGADSFAFNTLQIDSSTSIPLEVFFLSIVALLGYILSFIPLKSLIIYFFLLFSCLWFLIQNLQSSSFLSSTKAFWYLFLTIVYPELFISLCIGSRQALSTLLVTSALILFLSRRTSLSFFIFLLSTAVHWSAIVPALFVLLGYLVWVISFYLRDLVYSMKLKYSHRIVVALPILFLSAFLTLHYAYASLYEPLYTFISHKVFYVPSVSAFTASSSKIFLIFIFVLLALLFRFSAIQLPSRFTYIACVSALGLSLVSLLNFNPERIFIYLYPLFLIPIVLKLPSSILAPLAGVSALLSVNTLLVYAYP